MIPLALALTAVLDHSAWDRLLARYVTPQARVDYAAWKSAGTAQLDGYLATLAAPWPAAMPAQDRKAALINAYNALVVRWMIANYPVESIWKTDDPFRKARHRVNGKSASLDDVENRLRDMGDPRVHTVLVCAARSCPPLRAEAYRGDRLDEQMDDNARAWLGNRDWNEFDPARRTAAVSSIFKWFEGDFKRNGASVRDFLLRFAPGNARAMLRDGGRITHKSYHWGLNDTGRLGENYGGPGLWWNVLKNKL
jgi:hypothetical protein